MSALYSVCEQIFKEKFSEKFGKELEHRYYFYNMKSDKYQQNFTNNCFSVYMRFDDTIKRMGDICGFDFNRTLFTQVYDQRKLNTIPTVIVNVTKEEFVRVVEKYNIKLEEYEKIILSNIKVEDFKKPDMFDEGYNECDLLHILLAFDYREEDIKKVCNYARKDHQELFPKIEGAVYHKNRLYIPINGNYLVLSKNPYDFVWASTGNNYTSCFNLDSPTHYIQASPFMCTLPWFFMCYYTNGTIVKFSAFAEKKFKLPQMYGRFWCYKIDDEMYYDRLYHSTNYGNVISIFRDLFFKRSDDKIPIKDKAMNIHYDTYLDSLRFEHLVYYQYNRGDDGITHNDYVQTFYSNMKQITYNPNLTVDMFPIDIVDNTYTKVKICPMTGLKIDFSLEKHWLARYLDKPCKHTFLFTYSVEDNVLINNERNIMRNYDNLDDAKGNIRYLVDNYSYIDCIVLRIVKGNKMTFQPFYKKE